MFIKFFLRKSGILQFILYVQLKEKNVDGYSFFIYKIIIKKCLNSNK